MYAVEQGVTIPPKSPGRKAKAVSTRTKYPFAFLAKGDSFAVPAKHEKRAKKIANTLSACATYFAKKTGAKFTQRRLRNEVRVWRVA